MNNKLQDHFVVCGLGGLGQHCVQAIKSFGSAFPVVAIAMGTPSIQEIADLDQLLDDFILGDCCQDATLRQAQIERCRAALIVTADERINAETALAIRRLNPHTRLVLRSDKSNFNQLLKCHLGNFIAFKPAELPACALAWTALGSENLAWFSLEKQWLRLVCKEYQQPYSRALSTFNHHDRRLLQYQNIQEAIPATFYNWSPQAQATRGDRLIYLEMAHQFFGDQQIIQNLAKVSQAKNKRWQRWPALSWQRFWQLSLQQKLRSIAIVSSVVITGLLLLGAALFHYYYPGTSWLDAFYGTAVLLLGGYGDLFGGWEAIPDLPWWLQLFALSLSVVGTAFVGILYALLTEALLSARLQFKPAQLPIPQKDHIIVVGLDPLGCQIIHLLQQFRQPLVAIALSQHQEQTVDQTIPILRGPIEAALQQAHVKTAKSVILATTDEMINLEAALSVRNHNPDIGLVLRASGQRLSDHLRAILPDAHVLSVYALIAEAFAGAAFGENILNLFRLNQQTILVTEYHIEAQDTLNGLLLSDLAYGYGVVPVLHSHRDGQTYFLPPDDIQLRVGDHLIVLATIEGLRQIEIGQKLPKTYILTIEKLGYQNAAFEATRVIARISGCSLKMANETLLNLPQSLPQALYAHPAERLLKALQKLQIHASIENRSSDSSVP